MHNSTGAEVLAQKSRTESASRAALSPELMHHVSKNASFAFSKAGQLPLVPRSALPRWARRGLKCWTQWAGMGRTGGAVAGA